MAMAMGVRASIESFRGAADCAPENEVVEGFDSDLL